MYRKLSFRGFVHIYTSSRVGPPLPKKFTYWILGLFWPKTPLQKGHAPIWPPVSFRTSWSQFWELSGWKKELKTCAFDLFKTVELEYKTTIEKKCQPIQGGPSYISPPTPPYQNLTKISWTIKYSFGPWSQFWELSEWKKGLEMCASDLL